MPKKPSMEEMAYEFRDALASDLSKASALLAKHSKLIGYPLHDAAQLGHREVCEALLQHGANPDLKDFLGETAIAESCP